MAIIEQGPTTTDKVMYAILGLIFVAFIISLPFMARDNAKRLQQQWQAQGCEMYDDYQINNVPAKCQTYFIDHYQAQPARIQPPQETNQ